MPAQKYRSIYENLREKIESSEYINGDFLPSEYQLITFLHCSRNTARRAIKQLADEGYVQSIHGKGVRVIFQKKERTEFEISSLESLKEISQKRHLHYRTRVIKFKKRIVDEGLSRKTGFTTGTAVFDVTRLRLLEDDALIIDHNYFRCDVVRDLTKEIAEQSVYEYMEKVLGETIVTTKRCFLVDHVTPLDSQHLDLGNFNCLAVVESNTYNGEGVMFEFTQSRHCPDRFVFSEQVRRNV